jgi:hypothetical protein
MRRTVRNAPQQFCLRLRRNSFPNNLNSPLNTLTTVFDVSHITVTEENGSRHAVVALQSDGFAAILIAV